MKPLDNATLLNQLKWRYATKKFDPAKKVSAEDWNTLEQAIILSASSFGLQPWHFVVVTSPVVKAQLVAASYGQPQVADCSHLVVFAVKKGLDAEHVDKHLQRISEVRGTPMEKLAGFKGAMTGTIAQLGAEGTDAWSAKQVYIALGTLLTSAALLGIDSSPMEGIKPPQYDQILGLDKKGYATLVVAGVGYRSSEDATAHHPKVRFKTEDVVTHVR